MKHVQITIGGEERRASRVNYEYFRPGISNEEFYIDFLKKYFPYDSTDRRSKGLYTDCVPQYAVTPEDKKLSRKAYSDTPPFGCKDSKGYYYKRLTELRYDAGLDRGLIPNRYDLYDMAARPTEMPLYRPVLTSTVGGIFSLEFESSGNDDFFYQWMSMGTYKNGSIAFYEDEQAEAFRIDFWDCFCMELEETMSSTGAQPMTIRMRISPAITRNRGIMHEKNWKITNLSSEQVVHSRTEEEEEIVPECTVCFRRTKDYDGSFGFDWMRVGDTDDERDQWYGTKGNMTSGDYDKLASGEYKYFDQEWRKQYSEYKETCRYLIPWVTLMNGRKARFRVKMQVNQPSGTLTVRMEGSGSGVLVPNLTEIPADKTGDYYHTTELEVNCTGTFNSATSLEVYAGEELVGKMIFLPNHVTYKIKVALIQTQIDEGKKDDLMSKLPLNLKKKLLYLNQAFIECELITGVELDLTARKYKLRMRERRTGKEVDVNDFTGFFRKNEARKINHSNSATVRNGEGTTITEDLFKYINRELREQLSKNNPRIHAEIEGAYRIYFFHEENTNGVAGRANGIGSKESVVFKGYNDDPESSTFIHELFHCLGLAHTFETKDAEFEYKKAVTDNIMDYCDGKGVDRRISLWHWQMKKVWNHLKKQGL